jgi:hypothetical protein
MYKENRPFGIVKDSMVQEVESYTDQLFDRGIIYLKNSQQTDDPEAMFDMAMKKRELDNALVWKSAIREELPDLSDHRRIQQRLVILLEMIKDQVMEMVEQTDFGFLENMDVNVVRKEIGNAYNEHDISAIIFYICATSLHMQMTKISGIDE